MSKFIPDENGELTALDEMTIHASSQSAMPAGELGAAFAKMLLTLVALVVLLLVSYWFIRKLLQNRLQKGTKDASIQVLEKRMLSAKTILYVIEVEGKKVLIAESHLEVKRLESFEPQLPKYVDPSSSQ